MRFDPSGWLGVADHCCGEVPGVDEQALLRTALGRAYYAALLTLRARIEQAQGAGAVPRRGTHEAILHAVRTGGREFKGVSETLHRLRRLRNSADYELDAGAFEPTDTRVEVERSRKLVRVLSSQLPDSAFLALRFPERN